MKSSVFRVHRWYYPFTHVILIILRMGSANEIVNYKHFGRPQLESYLAAGMEATRKERAIHHVNLVTNKNWIAQYNRDERRIYIYIHINSIPLK